MVDLRDPDYAEACRTLGELFAEKGEWDLAVDKGRAAIEAAGGEENASLELHEQLGVLLEKAGRSAEALAVYEGIRKRDFQYEGIATRIESLREIVGTQAELDGMTDSVTQPAGAPAPPITPPASDDRYEVLEEVGRGGMGIVYKARDTRLGRIVAFEAPARQPEGPPDRGRTLPARGPGGGRAEPPEHRHPVRRRPDPGQLLHHHGVLEGFPLDAVLKKRGKLSVKDAVRLISQTATGLSYAHEQRIVHRDIKTSNLFFTKDRVVKIMDFGLAKMLEEVRRAATVIGGTPYYMAPEQAAGEELDHRADLYALGVTLFELLVGRVPFTEGDVTYHHRHTPAPDIRELGARRARRAGGPGDRAPGEDAG